MKQLLQSGLDLVDSKAETKHMEEDMNKTESLQMDFMKS